jgi:hypothetical protein
MSNPAEQQGYCAAIERDWKRRPAERDAGSRDIRLSEPAYYWTAVLVATLDAALLLGT